MPAVLYQITTTHAPYTVISRVQYSHRPWFLRLRHWPCELSWNRVALLVRLNQPVNTVNGEVLLYYNNVRALDEQALQYRGDSNIDIGGMYFSTFFGGSDSSWAPPSDVNAYFRNIQM
ncbi:hypothetical protein L226DRAFT_520727 [Lentinus tigrinus ALCF2SS1-7]|uniref:uncharacterized protein n=1 Tax=Lentinus tigrinus ALCF2SS1-7 TaxID=1328758 RepID=UPI001165FCCD|nr:hypothetical protein L226DRAFT_520727 [Lentinus tigrinus ALCF2SS1-7]